MRQLPDEILFLSLIISSKLCTTVLILLRHMFPIKEQSKSYLGQSDTQTFARRFHYIFSFMCERMLEQLYSIMQEIEELCYIKKRINLAASEFKWGIKLGINKICCSQNILGPEHSRTTETISCIGKFISEKPPDNPLECSLTENRMLCVSEENGFFPPQNCDFYT